VADRFWVGGTANWDGTAGTKWATTSGGAGGASVPTSVDDVFFTNLSTGTCTISAGNTGAKSINCTGFTGTIAGSADITVSGSVTLSAAMTYTHTGTMTFNANATITTAGKTFSGITVNGSGITVQLADALNIAARVITVTQGTFTTNDYSITAGTLTSNNSNTRTINLGSSTVTLSLNTPLTFTTSTNLTFNAGTSQINLSSATATLQGGSQTFYNVSFTSTASSSQIINGSNTFNNFTVTGRTSAGIANISISANQTINGTLSTTGTAGNRRVFFSSDTYGVRRTLTVNSAPSLTDADFRDIIVNGTSAPISGTRIGNRGACVGITFSTPKTVYWNLAGAQNWSANGWATTSTGSPSTDNFPLPQDTATFTNAGSVTGTITLDAALQFTGTVDMSGRTSAMTLATGVTTVYGNWTNGSGVTIISSNILTFSGEGTKTITSAGIAFAGGITVDIYGGSVELADALSVSSQNLTVTNGTFDTKNYSVTAGSLSSSNSNVRTIKLGSSTVTLSGATAVDFTTPTNLTFNAGTSTINLTLQSAVFQGGGQTFNNVSFTATAITGVRTIQEANTFNNLSLTASGTGTSQLSINANQTITGTLTCSGTLATQRGLVFSATIGTNRTITANAIVANDCDFRDITLAGSAAGASPTRAGDCGGNSGITFPAPKTVYWNLAGTQNWQSTGWATTPTGTPAVNNFPLAQDTATFTDSGSAGTISLSTVFSTGTIDASGRTAAMTLSHNVSRDIYGSYTLGSGVTVSGTSTATFSGRGTQTFTSAGKTITFGITVDSSIGTFQLGDALTIDSARTLTLTSGTFDAVTYNVTTGLFSAASASTLKMGSGLWTISGVGSVWTLASSVFYKETANILLSDTGVSSRTFSGGSNSYNKLTIGGATGTSTTTISGNNQFTELASTKTVAHTIALGTTTQTFGAWTVTGTAGNVVTLTGTGTSHVLAGSCTSGIDYLAMGSIGFAATSPAEFYAGANSTGTATAPVYRTAKPADSTRYWVGGTGNWSDTARWSTGSGGASGASVPRSHDDVVFDTLSNLTAYTATVNAVTGGIRCKALTIAGPATGNVTLAGSTAIDGIHGNVTLPATGLTRTYTGEITLTGSSTGKTITTNGVTLGSSININGVGCEWNLGSAISSNLFRFINGSFVTNNYNLTTQGIASNYRNARTISLGSSTISISGFNLPLTFGTTINERAALTFNAGTSLFSIGASGFTFSGNNQTFNDISFTNSLPAVNVINGTNTFNNMSFTGTTSAGLREFGFTGNQTINGTLTLSAGTNATMRTFVRSDTIGTTRTLTCNAVTATDIDFRDITIAGSAAPVSGTRLGDCKGNSGITFVAGKTVYWVDAGSSSWSQLRWSQTAGGTPLITDFPLAQDTAIFEAASPASGATTTINATYNIGTIDMSARTTNTMTLATGTTTPTIYGNWINGTGTTLSGTGVLTFAGRGSQTITSAGKTFPQRFTFNTPNGSITLQDAFICSGLSSFQFDAGTLDANGYNFTLSNSSSQFILGGAATKVVAIGSGTWSLAGSSGSAWAVGANATVTGTGIISLTSASAQTFAGGGISYSGITLNQGGTGTLTITGNNTFADITSTASGATTIALGSTSQRVANFTATGTAGNILTITGNTSNLIYTGGSTITGLDYLNVQGRAYGPNGEISGIWSAGSNSTNSGSLGWSFTSGAVVLTASITEAYTSAEAQDTAANTFSAAATENSTLADVVLAAGVYTVAISENSTLADSSNAGFTLFVSITEGTTLANFQQAVSAIAVSVVEGSTLADTEAAANLYAAAIQEAATLADAASTAGILSAIIIENQTNLSIQAAQANFNAARIEPVASADIAAAQANFNSAVTEATNINDVLNAVRTLVGVITENSDVADNQNRLAIFFRSDIEGLLSQDSQSAQANFNSNRVENLIISDQQVGYGWFRVVDDQTIVWTDVNNTQSITWTNVGDSQNPNWVEINNSQP
jgi:fibronectin-binding autotransporter adhesin